MAKTKSVKIAMAQLTSGADLEQNLAKMRGMTETAAKAGAEIVVFPEMAYFMGPRDLCVPIVPRYLEILGRFREWAEEFKITLLPGSLREPGDARSYNSLPAISSSGEVLATYRKVFLFKANMPDRSYDEGEHCLAGKAATAVGNLGLAICYDLRFPELFRHLKKQGAEILIVPSAFTVPTGQAHWSVLLRARAIENQCFVVAPAQTGKLGDGRVTYGHSQIISPWGEVLADLGEKEEVTTITLEMDALSQARAKVDAWASRREDLFPI